jgi:hypothetical protein
VSHRIRDFFLDFFDVTRLKNVTRLETSKVSHDVRFRHCVRHHVAKCLKKCQYRVVSHFQVVSHPKPPRHIPYELNLTSSRVRWPRVSTVSSHTARRRGLLFIIFLFLVAAFWNGGRTAKQVVAYSWARDYALYVALR